MNIFKNVSLNAKILGIVALSCVICGVISLTVAMYYNEVEFKRGLVDKSRTIHSRLEVAASYVANQGGLPPMIERYTNKYTSSDQLTDEDVSVILQQVPIYAAMKIGSEGADHEHYEFRVFSDKPRNPDNQATADEMQIFNKFLKDPTLDEFVEEKNGYVTVYRPVRLKKSHQCMTCHGAPSTSPWGNGKDILGYPMENWKDGKLHGVFAIKNNVEHVHEALAAAGVVSSTRNLTLFIVVGGCLALALAWLVLRSPIQSIRRIVEQLTSTEESLADTSEVVSSTSNSLSESTSEQAAAIQETTASLQEITSMVEKNSSHAQSTADSSSQSQNKAQTGKQAVDNMVISMEEINEGNQKIMTQVNESNNKMAEIVDVIKEIGNQTNVINDIVFQTKLLSFNASVEAARAGEAGKGFAVVAEEVGNLAQMSGGAAKEISDMLDQSIKRVEAIVNETKSKVEGLIQDGAHKVENGVSTAKECGVILEDILKNVSETTQMAREISMANEEQSQGVGEINRAMIELDQATQQNATLSEKAAKSSQTMFQQSNNLKEVVSLLIEIVEGQGASKKISSSGHSNKAAFESKENNVTPIARAAEPESENTQTAEGSLKKAANSDDFHPDYNHPGFEEM
jgi:methyl-accepting chemotaxis protein